MPEPLHSVSGPRTRAAALRVQALAEAQWGVVARGELRECGLSDGAVARAVARGALLRLHPGVYAVGHRVLQPRGRLLAALLYAGPDAALSHTTAGWWWGVIATEPRVIHISGTVLRVPTPELRVHLPRVVERVTHRRLAVTPMSRTLRDLAGGVSFGELRRAVAEADHLGLLRPDEVMRSNGRGRPGSAALRRALDLHLPELARTRSVLEERFLALVRERGVHPPGVNERVGRFEVDAIWRRERVIVELDGHASHARVAQAERDRERDLELRAAGYLVLRYTWQQVTADPDRVIADLRAVLTARG